MLFIKTLEEFLLENFTEKYHYSYNCKVPSDYDELIFIIDNMKEIHPSTFFRYVDLTGTEFNKKELQKDYHVSFYKCKKGAIDCYVMKHSVIEYVFKKAETDFKSNKSVKKNTLKKGSDYELVSNHNGYKVGDETSFGIIKNIFHYLDTDKYQYEIKDGNKVNYYNSSIFETNEKLNTSHTYTNENVNIGDIYDESDIYIHVQSLHRNEEDFYDGNLGERIEEYSQYEVKEIEISKICIDEYELDDDYVDDYISKYNSIKTYPPIVLCPYNKRFDQYRIIDGTHRANALYNAGQKTIIAFVGIKNKYIYK